MTGKSADWAQARSLCPAGDYLPAQWVTHYQQNPDVLTQMLGDLYRVYKSEQAKREGTSNPQGGRRKSHIDGNLEELWAIITPRFSVVPFPEAMAELRGKRTWSQIALRAGMDRRRLSALLRGASTGRHASVAVLTRHDLEALARAGDVHPAYFLEWRSMVVQGLVAEMFMRSPLLSVTAIKALTR